MSIELITGQIICLGDDCLPVSGKTIKFVMTKGPGEDGYALSGNEITMTSGADGVAEATFIRGATYEFQYGSSTKRSILKAPEATGTGSGTADVWLIGEIIGKP